MGRSCQGMGLCSANGVWDQGLNLDCFVVRGFRNEGLNHPDFFSIIMQLRGFQMK